MLRLLFTIGVHGRSSKTRLPILAPISLNNANWFITVNEVLRAALQFLFDPPCSASSDDMSWIRSPCFAALRELVFLLPGPRTGGKLGIRLIGFNLLLESVGALISRLHAQRRGVNPHLHMLLHDIVVPIKTSHMLG